MVRDWSGARAWSQHTLDEIEKGTYGWQDKQVIQIERMQHALIATNISQGRPQNSRDERANPCRDFNGERGCAHPGHHGTGAGRFMHICAYCYNQTGCHITTHGRYACIRKDVDSGYRPRVSAKNGQ